MVPKIRSASLINITFLEVFTTVSRSRSLLVPLCILAWLTLLLPGISGCSPTTLPSATLAPANTPNSTGQLQSTATPTSTSTPAPVPTPTEALTVEALPTLPPDVCPLSGEKVSDPNVLERRPLAVKISNFPNAVRPQAGLDRADIVFEHLAEANLTRFTAIFLCQEAEKIGCIRSARLIDLEIPAMYKAVLIFSGVSPGLVPRFQNCDFSDRLLSPDPLFRDPDSDDIIYRVPAEGKAYENTLFTDTKTLWQAIERRGWNSRQDLSGLVFAEEPPDGGSPATHLSIVYNALYATAEYQYDPDRQAYLRSVLGEPHLDEVTGEQITVRNVVVLYVNHVETDIIEDELGAHSIEIQLWGEGRAVILRDGRAYEVKWVRRQRPDMLRYVDGEGRPFPLKPGNTWVQVVPLDFEIEIE
ncbi:MAG TPA: DUF3048 domain-containing protein [Anaerolineae bacterium]|nr:DUF3048 domain-containing protein [Anaerolineae bacterium]